MKTRPTPIVSTRNMELFELADPTQGWNLYLLKGKEAEDLARIQALYSRSKGSIVDRIRKIAAEERQTHEQRLSSLRPVTRDRLARILGFTDGSALARLDPPAQAAFAEALENLQQDLLAEPEGSGVAAKFMANFFANYGHKSIGDCGTTILFFEGVPLHLPMQIQRSRLYRGQERSTRYQNMREGRRWNPLGTELGATIIDAWMDLYTDVEKGMLAELSTLFPFIPTEGEEPEKVEKALDGHKRALGARAFDIARGFLPMGASTSVSWTVDLRQANDHLRHLRNHPDLLVQDMANDALRLLRQHYAASFSHEGKAETDAWLKRVMRLVPESVRGSATTEVTIIRGLIEPEMEAAFLDLLADRPERADVHPDLWILADVRVTGELDVASYRDLHRQRCCTLLVPRIDPLAPIHSWYLDMLTPALREQAERVIEEQRLRLQQLDGDPFLRQCYAAMGTLIPVELTSRIGGMIYIEELRAKPDVHPTVRRFVHEAGAKMREQRPDIPMAIDTAPDAFYPKRGEQTIFDTRTGKAIE